MIVKNVFYDWFYSNECGEDVASFETGKNNVVEIDYHVPQGHGDQHYCDVIFSDGEKKRIFNINQIDFNKEEK